MNDYKKNGLEYNDIALLKETQILHVCKSCFLPLLISLGKDAACLNCSVITENQLFPMKQRLQKTLDVLKKIKIQTPADRLYNDIMIIVGDYSGEEQSLIDAVEGIVNKYKIGEKE